MCVLLVVRYVVGEYLLFDYEVTKSPRAVRGPLYKGGFEVPSFGLPPATGGKGRTGRISLPEAIFIFYHFLLQ